MQFDLNSSLPGASGRVTDIELSSGIGSFFGFGGGVSLLLQAIVRINMLNIVMYILIFILI